jgi:hypothetical protein
VRIKLTGERSLIDAVAGALDNVEQRREVLDPTELKFGIAEVATIIGMVSGSLKIAEQLIAAVKSLTTHKQKLQVETALGAVTITLDKNITLEELRTQLDKLFA